jgi:hypothetical protein
MIQDDSRQRSKLLEILNDFSTREHMHNISKVIWILYPLREFSKKFEMAVLVYSGAWGKLINEKNQKSKISWHCPFKGLSWPEKYETVKQLLDLLPWTEAFRVLSVYAKWS